MALALEHPDIHWYFPLPRPKGVSRDRLADALEQARHEVLAEVRARSLRPSWSDDVRAIYLGTVSGIRRTAAKRPSMAAGPVFIVGEAEMLVPQEASQEAANALLKLLEEPPGDARFILTSSEPGLLLPTIRSRTVPLHVPPLTHEAVRTLIQEGGGIEDRVAEWAARLGQGSPGRALAFLPDPDESDEWKRLGPLEQMRRRAYEIVVAAMAPTSGPGYEVAASFPPAGARSLLELFAFVEEWLRDLAAVAAGAGERIFNHDAEARLRKHLSQTGFSAVGLADAFEHVERARALARGNVNPQLVVAGLVRNLRGTLRSAAA
jgi:DNA polymerase-3 subunit delta'